jgi:hypothetical protein
VVLARLVISPTVPRLTRPAILFWMARMLSLVEVASASISLTMHDEVAGRPRCLPRAWASVVHGLGGGVEAQGDAWDHSPKLWMPILPFKRNQDHRHHFPRQQRKVTNWPAYDASLRQRGSLTVWFTDEAIAAWAAEPRATRGGQARYSPLAILTALTLRTVFRLA